MILPGTPRTFSSTCDCDDEDDNSEIHVSILTNPYDCDDEDDHKSQVGLLIDCDAGNEFLETPGSVPYQVKYDYDDYD